MRAEEVSAQILVLHTIAAVTHCSIGIVVLRALLILKRGGEQLPGFFPVALMLVVASSTRAFWLGFIWLSSAPPVWLDLTALAMTAVSMMAMPVVVAKSYLTPRDSEQICISGGVWVDRAMMFNGAIGGVALVTALALSTRYLALMFTPIVYIVAALLLCIRVELLRNVQVRYRGLLLFSRFTASGLISIAMLLLIGYTQHVRVRSSFELMALGNVGAMMMVVGVLFAFANLRLADLIVKQALRVTLLGCTSLLMCVAVVELSRWRSLLTSTVAQAALSLALIAFIALTIALGPVVACALDEWIDRWLFEQPDFDLAIIDLWRNLLARERIEDILRAAELFIRTTLSLSTVRIISASELWVAGEIPRNIDPGAQFARSLIGLDPHLSIDADVVLPLYMEDVAERWIVLARGLLRPPITAMELRFLERVVGQIQIRVSTLIGEQRSSEARLREQAFREELTRAELRALRAQINPHFLFNSLNTIADLTMTAPDRAEEMTLRLAAVFRYVLVSTNRQFTSVKDELEFSRSYLHIEEARFERRLKASFDIDPLVLEERVPALILQPLIENALKHGISQKRSGGTLTIVARSTAEGFMLIVSDDGKGLRPTLPSSSANGTRVGIANVSKRLETAYGDRAIFTLREVEGGGAQAVIEIRK